MTTHFNHDEHEQLINKLLDESDPQLLDAHVRECFVCQNKVDSAGPASEPTCERPNIPGYEFLEELPRGGMGLVCKVRQQDLDREVALKMIKADGDTTADDLKRFQREARTMARLKHANIVPLFQLGEHEGNPFFTMEFVTGGTLAQLLKERGALPQRGAAEMVRTLALAMAYAHGRGVIHRDLKPANILLTDEGVPKIADFGLSKQIQTTPGVAGTTLTPNNTVLGTPPYMAPEQAQGLKIDEKADVYALGVILYELLAGERPFKEKDYLDVIYKTIHQDPIPLRQWQRNLNDELEAICMKCLQKDAKKRPTAKELADALQQFLNRKSPWLLATTFLSSAAAVLLAMLLIFAPARINSVEKPAMIAKLQNDVAAGEKREQALAGEIKQAREITIPNFEKQCQEAKLARQAVEKQFEKATKITIPDLEKQRTEIQQTLLDVKNSLSKAKETTIPELTRKLAMADKREQEIAGQLKQARETIPQLEKQRNDARSAQLVAEGQLKGAKEIAIPGLEKERKAAQQAQHTAEKMLMEANTKTIPGLEKQLKDARLSQQITENLLEDVKKKTIPDLEKQLKDTKMAQQIAEKLLVEAKETIIPKLNRQLTEANNREKAIAAQLKEVGVSTLDELRNKYEEKVIALDQAQEELKKTVALLALKAKELSVPDSSAALPWKNGNKYVWKGHEDRVTSLVISPDGKYALSGSRDKTICLWDLEMKKAIRSFNGHRYGVSCVAFSPDGRRVLSGGHDNTVRLWDAATGQELKCFKGHEKNILSVAFIADGKRVISCGLDFTVRVWDVESSKETHQVKGIDALFFSDGFVKFSPDGSRFLFHDLGRIRLWDVEAGKEIRVWGGRQPIFSPDGRQALSTDDGGSIFLWDVATGKEIRHFQGHKQGIQHIAFTSDGRRIISRDGLDIRLWDIAGDKEMSRFKIQGATGREYPLDQLVAFAFSPDGHRAFYARWNSPWDRAELCLWDFGRQGK